MSDADRRAQAEAALRTACRRAQDGGLILIRDSFEVRVDGEVVGVCAFGAVNALDSWLPSLEADEIMAIEEGWDGRPDDEWGDVGARLAAEFSPVSASALDAA